ncbi:hypothetical protein FE783_09695 [Paenibacillus mesophilus]|uniref:hypothetical protein n=1 Tax=Paenibacillus mesophilus TaxID=2582849 RepID=UPI00110D3814|nr:hypothetical protein [Paenibacillus mesophilus]TMV50923.1 hypothetical protein FE783_09695 [Paenibacillus mesophilus]
MLSFEEKLAIADSFPELQRKNVSLGRVNYHCEASVHDKKTVVYHLHPNGNGYVYAGLLKGYDTDEKGLVSIRELSADDLRSLIGQSIRSLTTYGTGRSGKAAQAGEELWTNSKKQSLTLKLDDEDQMWYIFSGMDLDSVFETYEEAKEYLEEEGFSRS